MAKNPETGASAQDSKMMVRRLFEKAIGNENDLQTAKDDHSTRITALSKHIDFSSIRGLTILQEDMKLLSRDVFQPEIRASIACSLTKIRS